MDGDAAARGALLRTANSNSSGDKTKTAAAAMTVNYHTINNTDHRYDSPRSSADLTYLDPEPYDPDNDTMGSSSSPILESQQQLPQQREGAEEEEDQEDGHAAAAAAADLVTTTESRSLTRGLAQRHLSMLGIAGSIGTGLFLGLGGAVARGGPLGALLGYFVIGLIVCAVQFALGEVASLLPVTGSFVRHAEFLVDPAWGFAIGWNLVYGNVLSIPSEITAICVLFEYWTEGRVSPAVFIVFFVVVTVGVGMALVRVFGEVEFVFAMLKVVLVVFLILLGLVIDLGGIPGTERIGFRYWKSPGPFVEYIATGDWGRFLGFWSVMTGAVFSFAGVESLAMAAAETRNPRKAIPRACKRVFARVVLFYMLAVLVVGMLVASDDPRLDGSGDSVAQSPFVIAASAAGIKAIPSVVNAIVITSAWSASNQSLLAGTRVLYGLALKGQAPKIFLRTTSWGTPYMCVLLFGVFMSLSFMSLSERAINVFWWLVRLTSAGVLVSWSSILVNHIRLRKAMDRQGIAYTRLPWSSWWTGKFLPSKLYSRSETDHFPGYSLQLAGSPVHVHRHSPNRRLQCFYQG